jgi:putative aldouronate transport system permease protein
VLSKNYLPGHKAFITIMMFFYLFSLGLIPDYIVEANVYGLKNTWWAIWLPGLISSSNLIVMMNFFRNLPPSIEESACIDGCNEAQSFVLIALPMSKAAIATFTLFYAVDLWNDYLKSIIFIDDANMWPITVWLRQFIVLSQGNLLEEVGDYVEAWLPSNAVKFATIMISTIPIIMIYPFLQKHFAKGVMVGSVKG